MKAITPQSVPRLPAGVRLHRDATREQWVILAPERVIELDDIAYAIVSRCDGLHRVETIVDELSTEFDAAPADIQDDVLGLIDDLAAKRVLTA